MPDVATDLELFKELMDELAPSYKFEAIVLETIPADFNEQIEGTLLGGFLFRNELYEDVNSAFKNGNHLIIITKSVTPTVTEDI